MPTVSIADRQPFVRLLHRGLGLTEFFDAADRILAGLVPFDASCWLSLDPASLLPTSHFTREIGSDHLLELAANEFLKHDLNKFADLARASFPAGILSEATGGDLRRSARHSTVLAPHGFGEGDELRAVFLDGQSAWGCVAIHRRRQAFEHEDARRVVEVGGYIAEGIRRAILATALTAGNTSDAPGLIILRDNETVESMTPAARRWLGEMLDPTGETAAVPLIVASVAGQARRATDGRTAEAGSVRVPSRAGGWLLLHAALLDDDPGGRVGVVIHPAKEPEIADLIVEAYGLSRREREVTGLVLRGLSTREIAQDLQVSAYTVQDHLKAIFAKVGVRSRRELVARVFFQHYAPRIESGVAVRSDGWFVDASETLASTS